MRGEDTGADAQLREKEEGVARDGAEIAPLHRTCRDVSKRLVGACSAEASERRGAEYLHARDAHGALSEPPDKDTGQYHEENTERDEGAAPPDPAPRREPRPLPLKGRDRWR